MSTSVLQRHLHALQIFGANTSVGKTVISTTICKALNQYFPQEQVWYLKPVSTGPLNEADDRHLMRFAPRTRSECFFQFDDPVSPHVAARSSSFSPPSDQDVLGRISSSIAAKGDSARGTLLLETAGGVHSPGPSASSQADLYRSLRLPIWLIADSRLGGISSTISAYESLLVRGYDVDAVAVFRDDRYKNHEYLLEYFEKRDVPLLSLPEPPSRRDSEEEDQLHLSEFYEKASGSDIVTDFLCLARDRHNARIENLESMSDRAYKHVWYPFTQHQSLESRDIMTIDSAYGDYFQAKKLVPGEEGQNQLEATFDGSASWWTQGLGHGNPELSLAAAYAAGRYGHVMFAGAVNQPAIDLSERLLKELKNPRLQRVFFSDDGSTGMEVAIKMALTSASHRYKWNIHGGQLGVIGLKGSYHGDTIGAMDGSEPSTFNNRVHWYQGRGYWFDVPQIKMSNGTWKVEHSDVEIEGCGKVTSFSTLSDIFEMKTRSDSAMSRRYKAHIQETLERLVRKEGKTFGALIMEPVVMGAGGMIFVDPLFQHCLAQVVRENASLFSESSASFSPSPVTQEDPLSWSGLPVIFDEVFTGIYRLGKFSSASFLDIHPDISVHAKLLTGGLVPLCTTLASDSIYQSFLGSEKKDALLHGHSYTAHAVGCNVACTSLKMMKALEEQGNWDAFKSDWSSTVPSSQPSEDRAWSSWSRSFVSEVSYFENVESVMALGSVLAICLRDKDNAGYNSTASTGLQTKLRTGRAGIAIHSRILGNILYLMASLTSTKDTLGKIEKVILDSLQRSA